MFERIIEKLIFASRWLLVPLYLALAVTLVVFALKAIQEVVHLFAIVLTATETELILGVLSLIDLVLVANLLVMVVLSSYETFVSRIDLEVGADRPPWLGKLDAGTVKLKLAVSVVAVSSIHLLKVFMNIKQYNSEQIMWLTLIHLAFVASALLLALVDKIAFAPHRLHKEADSDHGGQA